MKDFEIRVLRACERYARQHPKSLTVKMDYNPMIGFRKINLFHTFNSSELFGVVGIESKDGRICILKDGSEGKKGLVAYLRENLPQEIFSLDVIVYD